MLHFLTNKILKSLSFTTHPYPYTSRNLRAQEKRRRRTDDFFFPFRDCFQSATLHFDLHFIGQNLDQMQESLGNIVLWLVQKERKGWEENTILAKGGQGRPF